MNKIKVVNNEIIPCESSNVIISNNEICFINSGDFYIDFIDCDRVNFDVIINENISVSLFIYSNNNYISVNNNYNISGSLVINKFYYNNNTDEVININLNKDNAS